MSTTIVFAQEQKYDLIIKNDGTKIEAIVQYVELNEVKYKNFNNTEGPLYSLRKDDIATILYANGTVEVFKNVQSSIQEEVTQDNSALCKQLQNDYLKAINLSKKGTDLWVIGLISEATGGIFLGVGIGEKLSWSILTGDALIIGGIILIIPGAIMAGIGNGRMRRISSDMNEICSLPLNKGAKYPVNLSFTTSGLALRF
ncbi:MAG: hypothetical protein J5644_01385 [Bacteroidales bacterium]|nr:hypothetical protein [Bacteroidales bacterium]